MIWLHYEFESFICFIHYEYFSLVQVSAIPLNPGFILLQIFVIISITASFASPNGINALFRSTTTRRHYNLGKRNAQTICSPVFENCNSYEIGKLSICSWTMQTNVNRLRRPKRIKEAVCDCDKPRIPGSDSLVCRPVYRTFAVKLLDIRTMKYIHSFERIAVACTALPDCSS